MRSLASEERADGVRVVRPRGDLDITAASAHLPEVPGLVAGARGVVLDLTLLSFFDSAGVRLVDALARACAGAPAAFAVVAPVRTASRRVLELVGMEELVADDLPAALESVRRRG